MPERTPEEARGASGRLGTGGCTFTSCCKLRALVGTGSTLEGVDLKGTLNHPFEHEIRKGWQSLGTSAKKAPHPSCGFPCETREDEQ